MSKNYTLTMTFSMEEPKDYDDFKWAFLRAVSSLVPLGSKEPMVVKTFQLQYGEPQGLAMRNYEGEFVLPKRSIKVKLPKGWR